MAKMLLIHFFQSGNSSCQRCWLLSSFLLLGANLGTRLLDSVFCHFYHKKIRKNMRHTNSNGTMLLPVCLVWPRMPGQPGVFVVVSSQSTGSAVSEGEAVFSVLFVMWYMQLSEVDCSQLLSIVDCMYFTTLSAVYWHTNSQCDVFCVLMDGRGRGTIVRKERRGEPRVGCLRLFSNIATESGLPIGLNAKS